MCVCIELDLEVGDEELVGDLPLRLLLSIRRAGMRRTGKVFALISASGGCACDMFDGDTGEVMPEDREDFASTVEALDRVLKGERAIRADWIGDKPSGEARLSAFDLASRIRTGQFKQGIVYRVSWRGAA